MVIPPIKFLPHLYADSSMTFLLESLAYAKREIDTALAYPNLEQGRQEIITAQQLHEAILTHIASPKFAHSEPAPAKARVQFPVEYAPRPTFQKLYKAECLEKIKTIESASIDCIITDPPYSQGQTSNGQRGSYKDLSMVLPFFEGLAKEYDRVLTPQGEGYCFIDWRGFALLYEAFSPYLSIRNLIVWDKLSGAGNHYSFTHEFIIFFTKKSYSPNKGGTNVWRQAGFASGALVTNGAKKHNAQKPLEIIETIIQKGCPRYGTVLDTFAGTGTTAIACIRQERNFIGFEHDKAMHELAVKRIEEEAEKKNYFCI